MKKMIVFKDLKQLQILIAIHGKDAKLIDIIKFMEQDKAAN